MSTARTGSRSSSKPAEQNTSRGLDLGKMIRRISPESLKTTAVELRTPIIAFWVHFVLVAIFAAIAMSYSVQLQVVPAVGWYLNPMHGVFHLFVQPLRNWDGFWYTLIAERGYHVNPAASAFWPVYPLILRYLHDALTWSVPTIGVIVSNVSFFFGLVYLYRLIRVDYPEKIAKRAIWLLVLFPTAYYFSAVYTESLFLLLTVAAIYYGRTDRWGRAAIVGALAALTRNTGFLILIPLGLFIVHRYGWDPRNWWRKAIQLILIPLAPLAFLFRLKQLWNDPLMTLHVQSEWARYRAWPWATIQTEFHKVDLTWFHYLYQNFSWNTLTSAYVRHLFAESQTYDLFITLVFIALAIYMAVKVRPAYSLYAIVAFVLPMFSPSLVHPLMSTPRFVLVLFPFFIAMAYLLRNRYLYLAVLALFIIQFAVLMIQFSTWFWVA